jgi:hypothetical protein
MGTKREKPPIPMVVKGARGLSPVAAYDAEVLWSDPLGTEYDVVKRTKRSWPQLKLYWAMLGRVVKATGKWPDPEHLHEAIKLTLGYCREVVNLRTGEVTIVPDSAALDAMDPEEFRAFFDSAAALLAERLGFDPLAFIEGGRAAA